MAELKENKAIVVNPHKPINVLLKTVSQQITCFLCKGYLIDATTIVECLHSCKFICLFVIDCTITKILLPPISIHFIPTTFTYDTCEIKKFIIKLNAQCSCAIHAINFVIVGTGCEYKFVLKSDMKVIMLVTVCLVYYMYS